MKLHITKALKVIASQQAESYMKWMDGRTKQVVEAGLRKNELPVPDGRRESSCGPGWVRCPSSAGSSCSGQTTVCVASSSFS